VCTLTYVLNENGYELFFNRDEQRSRALALPPQYNGIKHAFYPIDPQGQGTWLAVNKQGLSLALLNNYQAQMATDVSDNNISRGQLILSLLEGKGEISEQLQAMDLRVYQPFQLCIFPPNLSVQKHNFYCVKWDGQNLTPAETDLPITSSSVDFLEVQEKRIMRFKHLVDVDKPSLAELKAFHFSTEEDGKHSVNMQRKDAKTVSISHISVNATINLNASLSKGEVCFEYIDNTTQEVHRVSCIKE